MRIAYFAFDQFIPSKHAGFVHTLGIINGLQQIGHDITLYALPAPPGLYNILEWGGTYRNIRVKYVRFTVSFKPVVIALLPLNIPSFLNTWKSLSEQNPDIIHERFHTPNPFGGYIGYKKNIPRVLEVNSLYIEDGAYKNKLSIKLATCDRNKQFQNSKALITQTGSLKKMLEKITDKPVYVVPNGVDTEKFAPDIASDSIRRDLRLAADDIIITFVGSFREWHGVHQIPAIASEIGKKHKNVKFLLIGSGHLYDLVNKTRSDNMLLLGSKEYDRVPEYLAISDILIAPFDTSRFKYIDRYGFWWNPVKLFEYLSSGKPVVTYDYPEIAKIVKDAGMLAAPGNTDDFTDKLEYLIQDKKTRLELGKKGRELAIREYDWKIRAKQTGDIYKEVLQNR